MASPFFPILKEDAGGGAADERTLLTFINSPISLQMTECVLVFTPDTSVARWIQTGFPEL